MRLLVTGGAGFIGSNFLRMVCSGEIELNTSQIVVLDSLTYAGKIENLEYLIATGQIDFIHGDINDESLVNQLVKNSDLVINFAAESHVDRSISDPQNFIRTNIVGTFTLLEAARKNKLRRFMQISTDEVYGSIKLGSWNESSAIEPNSVYSSSKASADLLALSFHKTYGTNVVISRCSNNYGPQQDNEKLIPLIITNALKNLPIPIYGDGQNLREWIHVSDHCHAIALIAQKGLSGNIYNVGSGEEWSNLNIAKLILGKMKESNSQIDFVTDRPGHDFRYSVNYERIRKIGFKNEVKFEDGIVDTIDWYYKRTL